MADINFKEALSGGADKQLTDFKDSILPLMDAMLQDAGIEDGEKLQVLARMRSRIAIELLAL